MTSAWFAYNGYAVWLTVVAGVFVGVACGFINGVLINYGQVPAFITTLGMLYVARSLVTFATDGQPIGPLPDDFSRLGQADVLGIPILLIYAIVVCLLASLLLEKTVFGWSVRAIGGNAEAAFDAGINVKRVSTVVYTLSGCSAAVAGVLMAARLDSGQPSLGTGFELQVISAVIIGGTSLFGGIGHISGTILGSITLSILTTGLILLQINPILQNAFVGVIIIAAVGLDHLRRQRMFRLSPR